MNLSTTPDAARGVYGISVAAELVGMGTQTLRLYERRGLLEPARTEGGTRRYSEDDLDRIRHIGELLGAGLNLAGVALVLELETDNVQLRADNTQLREREEHRWRSTAPTRERTSPRRTSSNSRHQSTSTSTS